jgi:hypothetical protein
MSHFQKRAQKNKPYYLSKSDTWGRRGNWLDATPCVPSKESRITNHASLLIVLTSVSMPGENALRITEKAHFYRLSGRIRCRNVGSERSALRCSGAQFISAKFVAYFAYRLSTAPHLKAVKITARMVIGLIAATGSAHRDRLIDVNAWHMISASRDGHESAIESAGREWLTGTRKRGGYQRKIGSMSDRPLWVRSHHRHFFYSQVLLFLSSMLARIDLVLLCCTARRHARTSSCRASLEFVSPVARQPVQQPCNALPLAGDYVICLFQTANPFFPILMVERMRHGRRTPARQILHHVLEMIQLVVDQSGRTSRAALRGRLGVCAAHFSYPVDDSLAKPVLRALCAAPGRRRPLLCAVAIPVLGDVRGSVGPSAKPAVV